MKKCQALSFLHLTLYFGFLLLPLLILLPLHLHHLLLFHLDHGLLLPILILLSLYLYLILSHLNSNYNATFSHFVSSFSSLAFSSPPSSSHSISSSSNPNSNITFSLLSHRSPPLLIVNLKKKLHSGYTKSHIQYKNLLF